LGVKTGVDIFGFRSQLTQFFLLEPQRSVPTFAKIGWKCDRSGADRHRDRERERETDGQTDRL